MENDVKNYIDCKNKLLKMFKCDDEYFIKTLEDYNWRVKNSEGLFFLTYWKQGGKLNECIIVKKNNRPLIFREKEYTLIVAVECVKVALILKNDMEV